MQIETKFGIALIATPTLFTVGTLQSTERWLDCRLQSQHLVDCMVPAKNQE